VLPLECISSQAGFRVVDMRRNCGRVHEFNTPLLPKMIYAAPVLSPTKGHKNASTICRCSEKRQRRSLMLVWAKE